MMNFIPGLRSIQRAKGFGAAWRRSFSEGLIFALRQSFLRGRWYTVASGVALGVWGAAETVPFPFVLIRGGQNQKRRTGMSDPHGQRCRDSVRLFDFRAVQHNCRSLALLGMT